MIRRCRKGFTLIELLVVIAIIAVLIAILLFGGVVYFSGFVSVGSLVVSALMTLWIWLLGGPPHHVYLAFFIAVLIWYKHRDNIKRLLAGTEKSWKKKGVRAP